MQCQVELCFELLIHLCWLKMKHLFITLQLIMGGAIYSENYCVVSFVDMTSSTFTSNNALTGRALYCANLSSVFFEPNSDVRFIHNGQQIHKLVF